eukprot:scaffold20426_cov47-Attheya_sp.AAC.11
MADDPNSDRGPPRGDSDQPAEGPPGGGHPYYPQQMMHSTGGSPPRGMGYSSQQQPSEGQYMPQSGGSFNGSGLPSSGSGGGPSPHQRSKGPPGQSGTPPYSGPLEKGPGSSSGSTSGQAPSQSGSQYPQYGGAQSYGQQGGYGGPPMHPQGAYPPGPPYHMGPPGAYGGYPGYGYHPGYGMPGQYGGYGGYPTQHAQQSPHGPGGAQFKGSGGKAGSPVKSTRKGGSQDGDTMSDDMGSGPSGMTEQELKKKEEEEEALNLAIAQRVQPMRSDFHFYTIDVKDEHLAAARKHVLESIGDKKNLIKDGEPDPYLVMTNLNQRLMKGWEELKKDIRAGYLSKEEKDRKRFMNDEEIASRHCATLTARAKSPKPPNKSIKKEEDRDDEENDEKEAVEKAKALEDEAEDEEEDEEEKAKNASDDDDDEMPKEKDSSEAKVESGKRLPPSVDTSSTAGDGDASILLSPSKRTRIETAEPAKDESP